MVTEQELNKIHSEFNVNFKNSQMEIAKEARNHPNSTIYKELQNGSYKEKDSLFNLQSRNQALDKTYFAHCHNGKYDEVSKEYAKNHVKPACEKGRDNFINKSVNEVDSKKIEEYQKKADVCNEMAEKSNLHDRPQRAMEHTR